MREHQIVITLKPEQFLEVQRLARAANAKSMGIFVRQQLLAALGIEGSLQPGQAQTRTDLEPVVGQMKRLHSELKMFVAESLSIYNQEFDVSVVLESQAANEQIIPLESTATIDELERVAERTFAISPRLGSIAPADEELVRLREAVPPGLLNHKTNELYGRHELHRRDTHRYLHQRAASEVLDMPFSGNDTTFNLDSTDAAVPANSGGEPTISGLDPYYDEDVPRKMPVRDPLEQLLPDGESKKSNKSRRAQAEKDMESADALDEDDDDLFNVPFSIAERRRQLEEEPSDSTPETASEAVSTPVTHEDVSTSLPPNVAEASDSIVHFQSSDHELDQTSRALAAAFKDHAQGTPAATSETEDTSGFSSDIGIADDSDADEDEVRPSTGRPLGYPPFSGSPPPKRRQV